MSAACSRVGIRFLTPATGRTTPPPSPSPPGWPTSGGGRTREPRRGAPEAGGKCNIRKIAVRGPIRHSDELSPHDPFPPMTTKNSANAASARKKLITRIAATQRLAATAKKTAKLAKFGFPHAKRKFKDARRAPRQLPNARKTLKPELAALSVTHPHRNR